MIWEPFVLALFLGLVISAGLYFAYLWPHVEPVEPDDELPQSAIQSAIQSPAQSPSEPPSSGS